MNSSIHANGLACPPNEHIANLRTYVLSVASFAMNQLDPSKNTYELRIPLQALPSYMPFMINHHELGVQQGLLEARRFLSDWATSMAFAEHTYEGGHAMPGTSTLQQCTKRNHAA